VAAAYTARRMVSVLLKYERDYKTTTGEQSRSHEVNGVVHLWSTDDTILPSEAHFWAARLCVDFGVCGFTKLHVRLACTSRMLSRMTLRANAASRGTTRPTTGRVSIMLLGLRIGMLCHPRTLSSCLTELCLAAWLSLSSFSAPIFIPGREHRMD